VDKDSFHIRAATIDDARLLAELGARTFREAYASNNDPDALAEVIAATFNLGEQTKALTDDATCWFIADAQREAVGYAMLREGEQPAAVSGNNAIELARIYILQAWYGRGIGAALMQACLEQAAVDGYDTIWLGVWEHNPRAIAFYEKWGFEQVGAHAFQFGKERQTDLLMQRAVNPQQS
jgi:ribosomal protein S18 acetylase RimI-like enzyme